MIHFQHPKPKTCPSCESLLTVVEMLQKTIDRQQKLLMAFNRAGLHLAQHEETMAKLDIQRKENEIEAIKATTSLHRAETIRVNAESGTPVPRFGAKGHERTYVETP